MKIAFILPSLANKGPVVVAKDIIENLVLKGHIIHLYYFDDKNELPIKASVVRRISIKEQIGFHEYDIIHSHGIRPDYYIWKHRKKIKAKCFSTMHNYVYDDLKYQYNKLISLLFGRLWIQFVRRHDVITVLSEDMKRYYSKWLDPSRLQVIYNGRSFSDPGHSLLSNEQKKQLDLLAEKYTLLGVIAQLTKRKGVDQIIKILPNLKEFCLIIVGDGAERNNLESLAKELKMEDRCFFMGYSANGREYLSWIDIYMMVSRSEGFPLSLIEAASLGVPLVCSDIPIFKEVFKHQEVMFFKLENKNSLQESILSINRDRATYGIKAKNFYEVNLTGEVMANNYLFLYERCV